MLRWRKTLALSVAAVLCAAAPVLAQEVVVQLDPAQTHVEFTLGDVLHTVHGGFLLRTGTLQFDEQNGVASGQLTLDATTGASGSKGRDRKMHQQVLESAKYPEITFQPQRVVGHLAGTGVAQMEIDGLLVMHGETHPVSASGPVQVSGNGVTADLKMTVPYEQWGMKNPSTLFLRVSDRVEITVHAVGRVGLDATTAAVPPSAATH